MGATYPWEKPPIEIKVSMSKTIAMMFGYQCRIPKKIKVGYLKKSWVPKKKVGYLEG